MIFRTKIQHGDFLNEKSLWGIFIKARSIKESKFNVRFTMGAFVLITIYSVAECDVRYVHGLLGKCVEIGLNCSVGLLGFLIAGFTVFATLIKPQLLLVMAQRLEPQSNLSFLKYSFFTFTRTFIYFLVLIFCQICVILFGQETGIAERFSHSNLYWFIVESTNRVGLVVYVTLWCFTFLQLKSFVFNVYHIVMTMIKYEAVEHNKALSRRSGDSEDVDETRFDGI